MDVNPSKQGILQQVFLQPTFEMGKTGEMNMKRSLLMSVCAATLVAFVCGQAMATVTLSLNLRYTDPANEGAGGTWELLA
jgi:hypothetical protein